MSKAECSLGKTIPSCRSPFRKAVFTSIGYVKLRKRIFNPNLSTSSPLCKIPLIKNLKNIAFPWETLLYFQLRNSIPLMSTNHLQPIHVRLSSRLRVNRSFAFLADECILHELRVIHPCRSPYVPARAHPYVVPGIPSAVKQLVMLTVLLVLSCRFGCQRSHLQSLCLIGHGHFAYLKPRQTVRCYATSAPSVLLLAQPYTLSTM